MTDQLRTAWELLTADERPFGMVCTGSLFAIKQGFGTLPCGDYTAYDRICQAVEGVLFDAEWACAKHESGFEWWAADPNNPVVDIACRHPDRLTAANLALAAERGTR